MDAKQTQETQLNIELIATGFIAKTYRMVCEPSTDAIIHWNDEGSAVVIEDEAKLEAEVLGKHFKHSKFASFVRQLHFYVPRDLKDSPVCFYHSQFQRERPDLARGISRRTNDNSSKLKSQVVELNSHMDHLLAENARLFHANEALKELVSYYATRFEPMRNEIFSNPMHLRLISSAPANFHAPMQPSPHYGAAGVRRRVHGLPGASVYGYANPGNTSGFVPVARHYPAPQVAPGPPMGNMRYTPQQPQTAPAHQPSPAAAKSDDSAETTEEVVKSEKE